eukprot:TRINITY_DN3654_c0_g1_i3.p1 TRINITY_DN3654_c0_g1~~TRINITY_DN3654_c0_g1_i3.p1  ORF type:complete len:180 (-),score=4.65 TRINITY_DN3654_c0_g1_i3:798-1337(-)
MYRTTQNTRESGRQGCQRERVRRLLSIRNSRQRQRGQIQWGLEERKDVRERYWGIEEIGVYLYADGSKYEGEFRDNMRNGFGTLMGNCEGTYYFTNGNAYVGEWKDEKREGKGMDVGDCLGKITYANGDRYEGEWKGDRMTGNGMNSPITQRQILLCERDDLRRTSEEWKEGRGRYCRA